MLLGDDILIGDPDLGEEYRRVLPLIGVEYSPMKTYISPEMGEFAKRYLYRGEEVTPFPVSSVVDNLGSIPLIVATLEGELRKGLIPRSGIPGAVRSLLTITAPSRGIPPVGGFWDPRGLMWEDQAKACYVSSQFLRGSLSAQNLISAMEVIPPRRRPGPSQKTGKSGGYHSLRNRVG